ncbi:MAG: hypothetical protein RLZZ352_829 [Pseudomonadota bacterium]|jgi:uncharacterized tellurite resistance protein B-like protein
MGLFDMFKGDAAQAMTPKMALGASLLYMMSADGNVEQEEIGQLVSVLGGDRAALDNALKYVRKTSLDTFLQTVPATLSEPQKRAILINLCDSLLADGSAASQEQALFARFMTAMGFSEEAFRPHFETIALKNDKSVFNT